MYKNTIKSAGVGVYRISSTAVWPSFINPTLWTIFSMTKEDFVQSVSIHNILGGNYMQMIDLSRDLCEGEPIRSRKGRFNAIGLSTYQMQIPLTIIYSITKIDEETSLLYFLVWRLTPEIASYSQIIETFDIDSLVFDGMDEFGVEYSKVDQSLKIRTSQFCLESCWAISPSELISFLRRFIHPDDYRHFNDVIVTASEKLNYGNTTLRLRVLHKGYNEMNFWYSSSIDQDGKVNRIQGIIAQAPEVNLEDNLHYIKLMPRFFSNDKKLLHLIFDMDTNQRIYSENDLEISFIPFVDYLSTLKAIQDVFLRKRDSPYIDGLRGRYPLLRANAKGYDFFCCDVRMLACFDKNHANQLDYRWYHIVQEIFFDIRAGKALGVLSVYDIEEIKLNDNNDLLAYNENNSTYMQNFDAFILRFMEYFSAVQQSESSRNYSALALVKIIADPNMNENAAEAVDRSIRIINTLVHKDEIFGKFSENVFAILFHSHHQTETIQERIHMLDIGLSSIQTEAYSVSIDIGYCIMCDSDSSISSLLLERANISLFWAGVPNNRNIYQYSQENEDRMKSVLDSSIRKNLSLTIVKKPPSVSIRTFGSFDVFVDGKAIPFTNEKAKELLAVLVDRREGFVTPSQAISYLWEDEPCNKKVLSRLRKVALLMKRELEKYGIENIVESVNGKRRLVICQGMVCDYYKLLSSDTTIQPFIGTYMPEYSWAETTNAMLETKYNYFYEDAETMPHMMRASNR